MTVNEVANVLQAVAGKYLTFKLGPESYGLAILKVQELIGMMAVTHVPKSSPCMRGMINLRGKVIPVIDLRLKFGMDSAPDTERTCVIVVQVMNETTPLILGLIVDEVSEVLDIAQNQIEPPPSFGTSVDTGFILGMGKVGEKVVILLDVDRVFSAQESAVIGESLVS